LIFESLILLPPCLFFWSNFGCVLVRTILPPPSFLWNKIKPSVEMHLNMHKLICYTCIKQERTNEKEKSSSVCSRFLWTVENSKQIGILDSRRHRPTWRQPTAKSSWLPKIPVPSKQTRLGGSRCMQFRHESRSALALSGLTRAQADNNLRRARIAHCQRLPNWNEADTYVDAMTYLLESPFCRGGSLRRKQRRGSRETIAVASAAARACGLRWRDHLLGKKEETTWRLRPVRKMFSSSRGSAGPGFWCFSEPRWRTGRMHLDVRVLWHHPILYSTVYLPCSFRTARSAIIRQPQITFSFMLENAQDQRQCEAGSLVGGGFGQWR
jgi:hypothetical protein